MSDLLPLVIIDNFNPPNWFKKAYKQKMKDYHPDKVAKLGEELQELALKKSKEIILIKSTILYIQIKQLST